MTSALAKWTMLFFALAVIFGSTIDSYNLWSLAARDEYRAACRAKNGVPMASLGGFYYCVRRDAIIDVDGGGL